MKHFYRLFVPFFALLLALVVSIPANAATGPRCYVDAGAGGVNDGDSWTNAYLDLQTALSDPNCTEIWVADGVYKPGAVGNRSATFQLKNSVAVYGGFNGTETALSQRNWTTNVTILSGDIDNNDTNTDGNNIAESVTDIVGANSYHVVTGSGTNSTALLDGFVITAGQANGSIPDYNGGGMYTYNGSPTLTGITFSGNTAANSGGAMFTEDSSPTLTGITFSGNTAANSGGAMFNFNGSPTLMDVTFSGNTAANSGGGIFTEDSSPMLTGITFSGNAADNGGGMFNFNSSSTLTDVTFSGNTATNFGGGMFSHYNNPTTLTGVTFSGNTADYGGGMYNETSSPTMTNITFSGNTANESGGGMLNYYFSSPTLMNVTFSGNTANNSGGGMFTFSGSNPTLTNITFSGNTATNFGGGMYNQDLSSSPTLTNVIVWGNTATTGTGIYNNSSTPTISYSDIQSCGGSGSWVLACGSNGGNNIDADPLFVDANGADNTYGTPDDNLRLQLTSPAIDAGNNAAVPFGVTTDLDGKPRFWDIPLVSDTGSGTPPIVDMGAYETVHILYAAPTAQGSGNCYTWVDACTLQTAFTNAVSGNEIWVAAGVHKPGAVEGASFPLKDGVAVYGGFAGGELFLSERDWTTNVTILSGDIDNNDTNTDGNNIAESVADIVGDNSYHVVVGSGTDSTALLDGFIITAGQANGTSFPHWFGGGMYNASGDPTLNNLIFSGNFANSGGGGAMYNTGSDPSITNSAFLSNATTSYGGAISNYAYSDPPLTNVVFSGNTAGVDGGAIRNYDSWPTLVNVTFSDNSADGDGGAIYNDSTGTITLKNAVIWGNAAVSDGDNIYNYGSVTVNISYSNIEGCGGSGGSWVPACGTDGGGNIDSDPLFIDADGADNITGTRDDNLRLNFGSPSIETGTNTDCPPTDLDGLPRPADADADATATCDMGAYEAGSMVCGIALGPYTFNTQSNVEIIVDNLGSNLACLYVDEMGINHPNATGSPGNNGTATGRYWLIRGLQSNKLTDATSDFVVTLTLPHDYLPNPEVCKYPGGLGGAGWDCDATIPMATTVTRSGISSFSDWAVGSNVEPTAVNLVSFTEAQTTPLGNALIGGLLFAFCLFASLLLMRRRA
ncbi:MAG: hypothetical protein IAE79_09635 [Anaerolinea sp.]|nr:hypothetical protein [Anaerolinea sp.]